MLRKKLYLVLCCILLAALSACSEMVEPTENDDTAFTVYFDIEAAADCEIYAVHFEYYLRGEAIGGGVLSNADNSPLAADDGGAVWKFVRADFNSADDLSGFAMEIYIVDGDGNEFRCATVPEWNAVYAGEYTITLSGDYDGGFDAASAEK